MQQLGCPALYTSRHDDGLWAQVCEYGSPYEPINSVMDGLAPLATSVQFNSRPLSSLSVQIIRNILGLGEKPNE